MGATSSGAELCHVGSSVAKSLESTLGARGPYAYVCTLVAKGADVEAGDLNPSASVSPSPSSPLSKENTGRRRPLYGTIVAPRAQAAEQLLADAPTWPVADSSDKQEHPRSR